MKTILSLLLICCLSAPTKAQKKESYFPIWTFHKANAKINGISVGIASGFKQGKTTTTNGLRLELIGFGVLLPLMPMYPFDKDARTIKAPDTLAEKINGINISASGTAGEIQVNGFSAGFIAEYVYKVNGVSANAAMNLATVHNGLQFAFACAGNDEMRGLQVSAINASNYTRGVQIGLLNSSEDLRGFQFGIWNKNGRRKLPIINWQFKPNKNILSKDSSELVEQHLKR